MSRTTGREGQHLGEAWPTPGKLQSIACRAGWMDHRDGPLERPEHQLPDDLHRSRLALQEVQQEMASPFPSNLTPDL